MVFVISQIDSPSVSRIGKDIGCNTHVVAVVATRELVNQLTAQHPDTQSHRKTLVDSRMTPENAYTIDGRPVDYKDQDCSCFGGYLVEEFPLEDSHRCWILYAVEPAKDRGCGNFCVVKEVRTDQNFTTSRTSVQKPLIPEMTVANNYTVHANPLQYDWDNCSGPAGWFVEEKEILHTSEQVATFVNRIRSSRNMSCPAC